MATKAVCIRETDVNLAVSGNGTDVTYQIAIMDATMPPSFQGAIIDFVTCNMTNTDTIATFETKVKNAMQAVANAKGFTVSTFVIPTYKLG